MALYELRIVCMKPQQAGQPGLFIVFTQPREKITLPFEFIQSLVPFRESHFFVKFYTGCRKRMRLL